MANDDDQRPAPATSPSAPEPFLFDEFFASAEQRTVTIPVRILGRVVPITVKAGISAEDRLAAQAAGVRRRVNPDGSITVLSVDEAAATLELLRRAVTAWPFTFGPKHPQAGQPVPVTKEHLLKLLGGMDAIADALKQIEEGGANSLAPFVPPSGAV